MKGWGLIFFSFIITIWLYMEAKVLYPVTDLNQGAVQIFGLLGIMSLAWGFLLSTRHTILEYLFGGLDKAYKAHHILGGLSLVFLLQHPLFMLIGTLPHNSLVLYLLPFGTIDYTLGQLALYLMLFLLILTFYVPLPYRYWKWSHEWMGLVMILGGLHSVLVYSDVSRYAPMKIWIVGWSVLGILAYLYKRFWYYTLQKSAHYIVQSTSVHKEFLMMTLQTSEEIIEFAPGQYGFFATPSKPRDEHAFSILRSSGNTIVIGCKIYGNFTKNLVELKPGNVLIVKGPFGTFGEKMGEPQHVVWIAGGIGITPFHSMITLIRQDQKVEMFFSAKVMPNSVLTAPFVDLQNQNSNFRWIATESSKSGRISASEVFLNTGSDKNAQYMLCGPNQMMETVASDLAKMGIKRSHITYEDFGFK